MNGDNISEKNSINAYSTSKFSCNKRKFPSDEYFNNYVYNEQNERRILRENNVVAFGVNESTIGDRLMMANILSAIGINSTNEIAFIQRLTPKKTQNSPAPLLITLNGTNLKPKHILKAAKDLKTTDFKNVSFSPDLTVTQRMVTKQLIKTRIDLNKELKNKIPNAEFYYGIRHNKIVKLDKIIGNKVNQISNSLKIKINQMIKDDLTVEKQAKCIKTNQSSADNQDKLSKKIELMREVLIAKNISIKDINNNARIAFISLIDMIAALNDQNPFFFISYFS